MGVYFFRKLPLDPSDYRRGGEYFSREYPPEFDGGAGLPNKGKILEEAGEEIWKGIVSVSKKIREKMGDVFTSSEKGNQYPRPIPTIYRETLFR